MQLEANYVNHAVADCGYNLINRTGLVIRIIIEGNQVVVQLFGFSVSIADSVRK